MKISPMLLTEVYDKSILDDTTKIFQEKFNGIRALVHIKENRVVGIRNRNNNPILYLFPEFRNIEFDFDTGILDAEICVIKDEKSIFYGGIDKRRSTPTKSILTEYPATIVVFDALVIDDDVLLMKPYSERYKIFSSHIKEPVKLSINYPGRELWDKVVSENREGVVIKNPNCIYEVGKRSKDYLKLKNYKLCVVVVEKVEHNEKGVKIKGTTDLNGTRTTVPLTVECQLGGIFDIDVGSEVTIKYLDIAGSRLIQPTKVNRNQKETISSG